MGLCQALCIYVMVVKLVFVGLLKAGIGVRLILLPALGPFFLSWVVLPSLIKGFCLVLEHLVMPCSTDIPGRLAVF